MSLPERDAAGRPLCTRCGVDLDGVGRAAHQQRRECSMDRRALRRRAGGLWGRCTTDGAERFTSHDVPVVHLTPGVDPEAEGLEGPVWLVPLWGVDLLGQGWRLGGDKAAVSATARVCAKMTTEEERREYMEAAFAAAALSGPEAAVRMSHLWHLDRSAR